MKIKSLIIGVLLLGGVVAEAQNEGLLCDLFLRDDVTEDMTLNALAQGADPDYVCDFMGNRPIHIALNLDVTPLLVPDDKANAIGRFVERSGVDLLVENRRGESAVSLMEIRYEDFKVWRRKMIHEAARITCTDGIRASINYFNTQEPKRGNELALYTFIRKEAGVEGESVNARVVNEMDNMMDTIEALPQYQPGPRCRITP